MLEVGARVTLTQPLGKKYEGRIGEVRVVMLEHRRLAGNKIVSSGGAVESLGIETSGTVVHGNIVVSAIGRGIEDCVCLVVFDRDGEQAWFYSHELQPA